MTTREKFAELVAELDAASSDWPALVAVQMESEDEILAAILKLKLKPKAKFKLPLRPDTPIEVNAETMRAYSERWRALCVRAEKVIGEDALKEIYGRVSARIEMAHEAQEARRKEIKEQLATIGRTLSPRPGLAWTKAAEFKKFAYPTQTSPEAYAHTNAELHALDFAKVGLEVELRVRPRELEVEHPPVYRASAYEVWVRADQLELDIVKFGGHGLTLAEWLQQVHCRGMNPRVFVPGLPWGIEEKLGVLSGSKALSLLRAVPVVESTS